MAKLRKVVMVIDHSKEALIQQLVAGETVSFFVGDYDPSKLQNNGSRGAANTADIQLRIAEDRKRRIQDGINSQDHYYSSDRMKPMMDEILAAITIDADGTSIDEIVPIVTARNYSPNSASPAVSWLCRQGYIEKVLGKRGFYRKTLMEQTS